jgi:hypothetical protein
VWTTPNDWADGDKVTASLMGLVRDDFRFLYTPPLMRAINDSNQNITANPVVLYRVVDFNHTLQDTDRMHGGTTAQNEPATGLVTFQTPGKYLLEAIVGFEWSASGIQQVVLAHRAAAGGAWGYRAFQSPGPENSGGPRNIISVMGASIFAAGDQGSCLCFASNEDSAKLLADWGFVPKLSATWIGGP